MKKLLTSWVILLCMVQGSFGQLTDLKRLPVSISYYGENGVHPGLKLGTWYTFATKEKSKTRWFKKRQEKLGDKVKLKNSFAVANVGFYDHPNNHLGTFITAGIGRERVKTRKGSIIGGVLEAGYLRRWNKFKTYRLTESGEIETVPLAGNNAFMVSLSPIFGRDWNYRRNLPLRWTMKPSLQFLQYNHTWVANAAFEFGVQFYLKKAGE